MYAAIIFIKSTSKANPDISDYQIIKLSPASLFITTDISFNNPLGDYACKTFSELTQKAYADISVREQWNNFVLEYNNFLNLVHRDKIIHIELILDHEDLADCIKANEDNEVIKMELINCLETLINNSIYAI